MMLVAGLLATGPRAEDGLFKDPAAHALLAITAIGLLASFVWVESKAANPILPLRLFRRSTFVLSGVLSASTGLALFTAVVFVPLYLQYALRMGSTQAGLHLLPLMLAISAASVLGEKRMGQHGSARAGHRRVDSHGQRPCRIGVVYCERKPGGHAGCTRRPGLGIGLTIPVTTIACQRSAQSRDQGTATASPIMFRTVAGALAVSLLGALLSRAIESAPEDSILQRALQRPSRRPCSRCSG